MKEKSPNNVLISKVIYKASLANFESYKSEKGQSTSFMLSNSNSL